MFTNLAIRNWGTTKRNSLPWNITTEFGELQ
jgi:hypothetical protein